MEDERRTGAIDAYGVLGRPPRRDLQALVDLAAFACGAPKASLNLITADREHQVATVGFEGEVGRRADSMCAVSIEAGVPVVVPDTREDARFRDHPCVTGATGSVRFYAAHQLTIPDGTVIGTLCVFGPEPRALDARQANALATLADQVVDVLELDLARRRAAAHDERLADFAAQVSHDLKNPLTGITMSLELAREEAGDLEPAAAEPMISLLDRAARGAGRLQTMLDELAGSARAADDAP